MSCIHFKFKCDKKFDSVVFDGASCTLAELKKLIIQKKGLSKHAMDFDLLINNAQTKQVYSKPSDVIQRNSSVIVARIPAGGTQSPIDSAVEEEKPLTLSKLLEETAPEELARIERNNGRIPPSRAVANNDFWIKKACEQTKTSDCAPEEDELNALSTLHLRESTALNNGRRNQFLNNAVPHPSYVCHRCHRTGHFKHVCPLLLESDHPSQSNNNQPVVKRATGIPRSELIPLKSHFPGAYITSEGTYAIPRKDAEAIINADKRRASWDNSGDNDLGGSSNTDERRATRESTPPPPTELTCSLCKDLFIDAVMTPCCHENFCDSCIRNRLLESDEKECPACHQKDIPLDQIFANKFLRDTVAMYGRKRTCTVSELFDQREPDLDQAFTPTCLPRSSDAQVAAQQDGAVARCDSQQRALNNHNGRAGVLDGKSALNGAEYAGRFQNVYGPLPGDSLSDTIASFAVPTGCQPYDQSATFAAMAAAAAAAAFLLPGPLDTLGSASIPTVASNGIADAAPSNRQTLRQNGVQLANSQAAAIAAAALARVNLGRNEYFDGTVPNHILTREQFELLKETVSKLKAAHAKQMNNGGTVPSSKEGSSPGHGNRDRPVERIPAECEDREAQIPACCGDRSREAEDHHERSRHCHLNSNSADGRRSPARSFAVKRLADKHEASRRCRSRDSKSKSREGSSSANGRRTRHGDFTLNVLEFSEEYSSRPTKCRKTSEKKGASRSRSRDRTSRRRSSSANVKNGDHKFVLKPRLLSHVHSVKESCSTTGGTQAEQWVEKEAKSKKRKSKHKSSSKKEKKHKRRHSSSDGKKHHKSNRKHKKSSRKRAGSAAPLVV